MKNKPLRHGFSSADSCPAQKRFYRTWEGIRKRCTDKKDANYKKYGARGIRVEWSSFNEFLDEMWLPFIEHIEKHGLHETSIDRIDSSGNYKSGNCRWATWGEQNNNRRNNTVLKYGGKCLTISQWSKETGLAQSTISTRLRIGWSVEDALTKSFDETSLIGSRHGKAKLTEEDVLKIRATSEEHTRAKYKTLAKLFGVTARTIEQIIKRERWKHI